MVVKLALLRGLSRCVWVHVFAYLTVFLRVLLFAGSYDNTVRLWEVATQRELAVLTGHTNTITSVAFDGSGKYLASGGARGATSSSIAVPTAVRLRRVIVSSKRLGGVTICID